MIAKGSLRLIEKLQDDHLMLLRGSFDDCKMIEKVLSDDHEMAIR
jgi:hypothetical protein